jgi:hypothetical protein
MVGHKLYMTALAFLMLNLVVQATDDLWDQLASDRDNWRYEWQHHTQMENRVPTHNPCPVDMPFPAVSRALSNDDCTDMEINNGGLPEYYCQKGWQDDDNGDHMCRYTGPQLPPQGTLVPWGVRNVTCEKATAGTKPIKKCSPTWTESDSSSSNTFGNSLLLLIPISLPFVISSVYKCVYGS